MKQIACFISPHGFGHATRVIAILEALQGLHPDCHAHLFTTVAESLFASLADCTYHPEPVDLGLVQGSALSVDIPATCARLRAMLPYSAERLRELAARCSGCSFILCDIAPLGIAVGQMAKIPSVLVENFTWDWIYEPYGRAYPELRRHAQVLGALFQQADFRIQTEPLCRKTRRDLVCGPIFRRLRTGREEVRARLEVRDRRLVLITLGGIAQQLPDLELLGRESDLFFVIAGPDQGGECGPNCLLLPRYTALSHPDLIAAADLVVTKPGYSTLAECCQAGARTVLISRGDYPESLPLEDYARSALGAVSITPEQYDKGEWLRLARGLLARPGAAAARENGADRVAAFLSGLL